MKKINSFLIGILLLAFASPALAWNPPGGWGAFSQTLFSGKYQGKFSGETVTGTTGGYSRLAAEATATLSGASTSILVNVPSGSRILGVQLRVDTLITSAVGVSWAAAFVNVPTTAITSGQAFTKNTKFSKVTADEISTDVVTIAITPNAGTFTAGVIRAIVYYEFYDVMADKN
jgi:hypothetical protein